MKKVEENDRRKSRQTEIERKVEETLRLNAWRRKLSEQKMNEEKTVERNEGCTSQESKMGAYEELRLEGGEAGTNYRGPAARKGSPGPGSIAYVFTLSVVSPFVHCIN